MNNRYTLVICLSSVLANFVPDAAARLKGEGIIGGDVAEKGQFPYQATILVGRSLCGGSIIDERHVVTAAHCVYTWQNKFVSVPMKIVAGVDSLTSYSAGGIVANVAEVYIPKEFDPNAMPPHSATGDIAVLKLKKDLDFDHQRNIGKVELPRTERNYVDAEAVVTGFGLNKIGLVKNPETGEFDEAGSTDGKLRFAKANVLADAYCQRLYNKISEKHLCARVAQRDPESYEGICAGDSGGPLVYNNTLIGVANVNPVLCREKRRPAIYARVAKFVDFIDKAINGQIDDDIRAGSLPVFG